MRPAKYRVGQWVYYYNPRRYKGRQDKWSRKFTGPFCVVRVLGPVNVELKRSILYRPFICHIDKIKHYLEEAPKGWLNESPEVEVAELIENAGDEAEVLKEVESNPVDNGPVTQPLASEPIDVITNLLTLIRNSGGPGPDVMYVSLHALRIESCSRSWLMLI